MLPNCRRGILATSVSDRAPRAGSRSADRHSLSPVPGGVVDVVVAVACRKQCRCEKTRRERRSTFSWCKHPLLARSDPAGTVMGISLRECTRKVGVRHHVGEPAAHVGAVDRRPCRSFSGASKLTSSSTRSSTVCRRRAPMFSVCSLTLHREGRRAARLRRRVNSSVTPSAASSALYCSTSAFFGCVRIVLKSSAVSESSSTRIGKRPCSSGIRSDGLLM